jgi:hypothetical protein
VSRHVTPSGRAATEGKGRDKSQIRVNPSRLPHGCASGVNVRTCVEAAEVSASKPKSAVGALRQPPSRPELWARRNIEHGTIRGQSIEHGTISAGEERE